MAPKLEIAIVVASRSLSLSELTLLLRTLPQAGSHDKDSIHPRNKRPWGITTWRKDASDTSAPFETQWRQILKDMPPECAEIQERLSDLEITLNIAAYFESAYFDLVIPSALIDELAARKIDVEITAYPCTTDNTDQ